MLRYYDEIGLLKPAQIDANSGYRLYSVDQISTLQKIVLLRDIKFDAEEIADALEHWDNHLIVERLEEKIEEIRNEIRMEEQRIDRIKTVISDFRENAITINYNISFRSIPSLKIVSLRSVIPDYSREGILWARLYGFIEREHIEILHRSDNNLAIYYDEGHKDADVDVEVGIAVKTLANDRDGFTFRETEKIDTMACMMVYGPYKNISRAYQSFAYWLEKHKQYKMAGFSRQICHKGPYNEEDPDKYLTEIQTPVIKRM